MEGVIALAHSETCKIRPSTAAALIGLLALASCSLFAKTVEVLPGYTMKLPYGYDAVDSALNSSLPNSDAGQMKAMDIIQKKENTSIQMSVARVDAGGMGKSIASIMDQAMGSKLGNSVFSKTIPSNVCTFDARGYQPPFGKATILTATCDEQGKSWMITWMYSGECDQKCQDLFATVVGSLKARK